MIRNATSEDIPALLALGRQFHAESRWGKLSFAEEKVERTLRGLIVHDDGFLMVGEQDGVVIGGIAGMCHEMWSSHSLMASDLAIFIAPDRRGNTAILHLARAFVKWGKNKGAEMVQIGISSGVRVEESTRAFERMGFETIGPIMEYMGV